jgi:hypothetical protein
MKKHEAEFIFLCRARHPGYVDKVSVQYHLYRRRSYIEEEKDLNTRFCNNIQVFEGRALNWWESSDKVVLFERD